MNHKRYVASIIVIGFIKYGLCTRKRTTFGRVTAQLDESVDRFFPTKPTFISKTVSYQNCVQLCLIHKQPCLSLNFNTKKVNGSHNCLLFSMGVVDQSTDNLRPLFGWVYAATISPSNKTLLQESWVIQQRYTNCDQEISTSCSDALQANRDRPGYYRIRATNSTILLFCYKHKGNAMVNISHSHQNVTKYHSGLEPARSFTVNMNYTIRNYELAFVTSNSKGCTQFFSVACYGVKLTRFASWVANTGAELNFFGRGQPGDEGCECGRNSSCVVSKYKCNCDKNDLIWRTDEGYFTNKKLLPVQQMKFGDMGYRLEKIKLTLGNLTCMF